MYVIISFFPPLFSGWRVSPYVCSFKITATPSSWDSYNQLLSFDEVFERQASFGFRCVCVLTRVSHLLIDIAIYRFPISNAVGLYTFYIVLVSDNSSECFSLSHSTFVFLQLTVVINICWYWKFANVNW